MKDIVEFLRVCLAEDQATAEAAQGDGSGRWHVDGWPLNEKRRIEGETFGEITIYDEGGHDEHQAAHIARHDPARVLADVAAKRAVIDLYEAAEAAVEASADTVLAGAAKVNLRAYGNVLRALTVSYADRPSFKPEWRLS